MTQLPYEVPMPIFFEKEAVVVGPSMRKRSVALFAKFSSSFTAKESQKSH